MTVNIVDILNIHLWMLALVELQIWVYLRKFTIILLTLFLKSVFTVQTIPSVLTKLFSMDAVLGVSVVDGIQNILGLRSRYFLASV